MCSSSCSSSPFFLPAHNPSLLLRRRTAPSFLRNPRPAITSPTPSLCASLAESNLEPSWSSTDQNVNPEYGGWAIVDSPDPKKKTGLPTYAICGIGASLAVLFAAISHFSLSRRGFRFHLGNPLHALHGTLSTTGSEDDRSETRGIAESDGSTVVSESNLENMEHATASIDMLERVVIPPAVDSTQLEALSVLKKLKVIEEDFKADELCTRREYARWLVQLSSSLERNPKHRIIPAISLSGSIVAAFDDIGVEDPDFWPIQALAEAGVIPSKLSLNNSAGNGSEGQENVCFSPERFISRQDLIDWKAQLEYELVPGIVERISRTKLGFLDVREISSDASVELLMDLLAGENSILRKVFGHSKRLQPNKPSTKAQAAVALTSGRMTEAIHNELARLEAENSARQEQMEDIISELLERGDIQRFWDGKLIVEKARGFEVEKVYFAALSDLEQEKIIQEKTFSEYLKEKSAMDCQRQLVVSLKEEVAEMSEKLASERAMYITEQHKLQEMLSDLQTRQERLLDTKSILEAEKEALRILRSWVEDEAKKNQARAKVLEEVGRRWKWDNQA